MARPMFDPVPPPPELASEAVSPPESAATMSAAIAMLWGPDVIESLWLEASVPIGPDDNFDEPVPLEEPEDGFGEALTEVDGAGLVELPWLGCRLVDADWPAASAALEAADPV